MPLRCLVLLLASLPLLASDQPAFEAGAFVPESAWNRLDAVLQVNTFAVAGRAMHEVTAEWAAGSHEHQFGFTVPMATGPDAGVGAATVNYQLAGNPESRVAAAPRVTVVLPQRGGQAGAAQLALPIGFLIHPRLSVHAVPAAAWTRDRAGVEWSVAQSLALAATPRLSLSIESLCTHCVTRDREVVVRPTMQLALDLAPGLRVAPGFAVAVRGSERSMMALLAVELTAR